MNYEFITCYVKMNYMLTISGLQVNYEWTLNGLQNHGLKCMNEFHPSCDHVQY